MGRNNYYSEYNISHEFYGTRDLIRKKILNQLYFIEKIHR